MNDFLVFATEADAAVAIAEIDAAMGYPMVGVNAATGLPDPEAVGAETWSTPVQRLDGLWIVPRHPDFDVSVPPFAVEAWSNDWFPA